MTVAEMCQRAHTTAFAKGWHEEPRSLGEAIALMHSEVSEDLECWRGIVMVASWVKEKSC
jgi:hypothetical protein